MEFIREEIYVRLKLAIKTASQLLSKYLLQCDSLTVYYFIKEDSSCDLVSGSPEEWLRPKYRTQSLSTTVSRLCSRYSCCCLYFVHLKQFSLEFFLYILICCSIVPKPVTLQTFFYICSLFMAYLRSFSLSQFRVLSS